MIDRSWKRVGDRERRTKRLRSVWRARRPLPRNALRVGVRPLHWFFFSFRMAELTVSPFSGEEETA